VLLPFAALPAGTPATNPTGAMKGESQIGAGVFHTG
jgi:hypothetical protein